jgi:aldose 1-epimerase
MFRLLISTLGLVLFMNTAPLAAQTRASTAREPFGKTADGTVVERFTFTNKNGMVVKVLTYGGIVSEIHVPDRDGKLADVCLGFDNLDSYLKGHPFFGCITGRVANRIAKGKFSLAGKEYTLHVNNGPNSLHGGKEGFDKKVWKVLSTIDGTNFQGLKLHYQSKDGEEGYPGTLDVTVTYTLTDSNELKIDYAACTDAATPVNLTNHAYFNLTGGKDNVLGHKVSLNCHRFTPGDETLIPTGEIKDVTGTPLDFFTRDHALGERIKELYDTPAKGYDHNFVITTPSDFLKLGMDALQKKAKELGETHPDVVAGRKAMEERVAALKANPQLLKNPLHKCATVTDPASGRVMTMFTTEPGVQLYTGNFLDGSVVGKGGVKYDKHLGVCLEAQHYPNSVNTPSFPNTVLKPGENYQQTTVYAFGVMK